MRWLLLLCLALGSCESEVARNFTESQKETAARLFYKAEGVEVTRLFRDIDEIDFSAYEVTYKGEHFLVVRQFYSISVCPFPAQRQEGSHD